MKAVLVIDTPEDCKHCPLMASFNNDADRCSVTYDLIDRAKCPLRPLPERKEPRVRMGSADSVYEMYDDDADAGWNACLDEITGCDKVANKL